MGWDRPIIKGVQTVAPAVEKLVAETRIGAAAGEMLGEAVANTGKLLEKTGIADVLGIPGRTVEITGSRAEAFLSGLSTETSSGGVELENLASQMNQYPTAHEFRQLLQNRAVTNYPDALRASGLSDVEITGKLDSLSRMLRCLDCELQPTLKSGRGAVALDLPQFGIKFGNETLGVQKIAAGDVAHVYKLSLGDERFALKVPSDPARMDVHGSYSESGALSFLSKYDVQDAVAFHGANPSPSGGWILSEFVSRPTNRTGEKLADVLGKHNLRFTDDGPANRGPGGVAWDFGGIEPIGIGKPPSFAEFKELMTTREGRMVAGRRMENIRDQGELKQALMYSLEFPEPAGQVARSASKLLRSSSDMTDVFAAAFRTDGAAGRAGFELDKLAKTPGVRDLYYDGLNHPESRIEVAKQIDQLLAPDRKAAFDAAFIHPESRPMAARAIEALRNPVDRTNALDMAMQDPGAKTARLLMDARDGSSNAAAQKSFATYMEQYGLASQWFK